MADSKDKKKGFQIPKLTETQWSILGGVVFLVGYLIYDTLTAVPAPRPAPLTVAPSREGVAETDEERFKRENKNAELPDGSAVPSHVVEEKTQLTQQIPFGDRELEFRVRLPSSWVMSEFARYGLPEEEDYSILTNIARYFGPAVEDMRPYLWVEVERLKRQMKAEVWAHKYMVDRGIAPDAIHVVSPTEVQALYVGVRDMRSYAVRSRFIIEGDRMVLVSFGVPVYSYNDFKDMVGLSINSFELLHSIDREIEKTMERKLLSVASFRHYASWQPKKENIESMLRPSIELHNPREHNNPKGDILQGLILLDVWRKTDQFSETVAMEKVTGRMNMVNMALGDPVNVEKPKPSRGFKSIEHRFYVARQIDVRQSEFDIVRREDSLARQGVYLSIIDNGYYVAYITLITPLREQNYLVWAQNMEQYELLQNSLYLRSAPGQ